MPKSPYSAWRWLAILVATGLVGCKTNPQTLALKDAGASAPTYCLKLVGPCPPTLAELTITMQDRLKEYLTQPASELDAAAAILDAAIGPAESKSNGPTLGLVNVAAGLSRPQMRRAIAYGTSTSSDRLTVTLRQPGSQLAKSAFLAPVTKNVSHPLFYGQVAAGLFGWPEQSIF